jgi:hypothetical protein
MGDGDETGTAALERSVALLVCYKYNYLVMCLLEYTGLLSVYIPLNFKHIWRRVVVNGIRDHQPGELALGAHGPSVDERGRVATTATKTVLSAAQDTSHLW